MDDDRGANNLLRDFKSDIETVRSGFRIPMHATVSKVSLPYLLEATIWAV
jgi:hypothetical protein